MLVAFKKNSTSIIYHVPQFTFNSKCKVACGKDGKFVARERAVNMNDSQFCYQCKIIAKKRKDRSLGLTQEQLREYWI